MMRLPSVEDRLSRRLAEGHHRHVAAECELVRLDPQRLARFDRRDRVPANMQQRVKEAEDRERPQIEAAGVDRSEEHTSELQSLMRISYAVFCLKKTTKK